VDNIVLEDGSNFAVMPKLSRSPQWDEWLFSRQSFPEAEKPEEGELVLP
jgi:hypothetical protein